MRYNILNNVQIREAQKCFSAEAERGEGQSCRPGQTRAQSAKTPEARQGLSLQEDHREPLPAIAQNQTQHPHAPSLGRLPRAINIAIYADSEWLEGAN